MVPSSWRVAVKSAVVASRLLVTGLAGSEEAAEALE